MDLKIFNTGNLPLYKSYSSNPFNGQNTYSNYWEEYFANDKNTTTKVSTLEAMSLLNKTENKTKKQSPEEIKEAKNKEIATKKMTKLLKKIQKQGLINFTKKHQNALKLIKANPALQYISEDILKKIEAVGEQSNKIMEKLASSTDGNLSSNELNSITEAMTKSAEQLSKNAQKILSGLVKIGAYSEAMLLVNDDTKKEKYRDIAVSIESTLPDVSKLDIQSGAGSSTENEIESAYDTENSTDETNETTSAGNDNNVPELNTSGSDDNPFAMTNITSETSDNTISSSDSTVDDTSDDNSETADKTEKTDSDDTKELSQLKDEVKDEQKKHKAKNYLTDSFGNILSSVLFS